MADRRRVARVVVPWRLSAGMLDSHEVRILDLSTAGVGIQHGEPMQPGAACTLKFPLPFGSLHLAARVVWSMIRGAGPSREGDRELHDHSGLAFTELTSEQQAALARALETLQAAHDARGRDIHR